MPRPMLLLALVSFLLLSGPGESRAQENPLPPIWFDDLTAGEAPTAADAEALVGFAAEVVGGGSPSLSSGPIAGLAADTRPRIVFLSACDPRGPGKTFLGSGAGLTEAVTRAAQLARERIGADFAPVWFKLDLVCEVRPAQKASPFWGLELDPGLQGIAFPRALGVAVLPDEIPARALLDGGRKLAPERWLAFFDECPWRVRDREGFRAATTVVSAFRVVSVFFDGTSASPLYRGHRLYPEPTAEQLLAFARAGGRYLVRGMNPEGRFTYLHRPDLDLSSSSYNILRHSGSVYSLLELHEATGDAEFLEAARRGVGYLMGFSKPAPAAGGDAAFIAEAGEVKLGGNALAIVAVAKLVEVTGERIWLPAIRKWGRWIRSVQTADGCFAVQKQSESGAPDPFISEYYPGEALLALVRLHALDPEGGWIDAAAKGAHWLIEVRDRGKKVGDLIHDHWLLYALNEIHRARPDPIYLSHAANIARAIRMRQHRDAPYPDWVGGWLQPPRSTPAATRTEGLAAACRLARDFGPREEAPADLEAIQLGVRFQLQTQIGPERAMMLRQPALVLGAFTRSLDDLEIRIDYIQHNVSSLLALRRLISEKE